MAVNFKTFLFILVSILQNVCLVPIDTDSKLLRTKDSAILSYDGIYLVRVKKELVRVGWCGYGKQRHFGKCMTQEEYQRAMDNEYGARSDNAPTKKVVAVPRKEVTKTAVKAPDKTAVKTSTTTYEYVPLHKEQLHGTENTRRNDFGTTEVSSTAVYHVSGAEELQNKENSKDDLSDKIATKTSSTTVYYVEDAEKLQNTESTQDDFSNTIATKSSSSTVYHLTDTEELKNTESTKRDEFSDTIATETSSVPVYDVSDPEELDTQSRFDADTMRSQVVTSRSTSDDKSDVNLERVKNLTFTLLMVGGVAVVLTWLYKLLYDYYLRKEDRTTYIMCSVDEVHELASSRQRLCPRN